MDGRIVNEEFLEQAETLRLLIKNSGSGAFGGNHTSRTFGSSCEFADTREYEAGEDVTKIDWNAYARFRKLYVKKYLDERQTHTRIYVDASKSMGYGKGEKGIQALKIAATLAYLSACDMDRVSVYLIRGRELEEVFVNVLGKESYLAHADRFNGVEFGGECEVTEALLPSTVGYEDGLSAVISDFLTDSDFLGAVDYLAGKRRDILYVQVLTAEELDPKARGKMHFYDSEDGKKYYRKNIGRDVIRAYKEAVEYATGRVRNYCLSRGAEYLLVSAEEDLGKVFFEKLTEGGVAK